MPAQWSLPMPGTVKVTVFGVEPLIACLLLASRRGRPWLVVRPVAYSVTSPVSEGIVVTGIDTLFWRSLL